MSYFPFKDIVTTRPYPPTGMSTRLWPENSEVMELDIKDLILTQSGVLIRALFRDRGSYSGDDTPHVVFWNGNFYLEDGHHRAVTAALAGHKTIYARVFKSPVS